MEIKYTKEQTDELVSGYKAISELDISDAAKHDEREDFILKYMGKHDKSKKSIIAKLSKSGVYISRPRISKVTGEKPETKEQMLQKIANKLGMDVSKLEGIDKSPKIALQNLLKRLDENEDYR